MPVAEIIAIGTELLLGQIQDTNTSYIARTLNAAGIDIFRATMIGDNEMRIAGVIQETMARADIIITTGGLGPTVDDQTRNAVAIAFGEENEYHPELWEEIKERFRNYGHKPSENNKRQAFLPGNAVVIHNPVGTAPAFYFEKDNKILFSLPGVPSEMKKLLHDDVIPIIQKKFELKSIIITRVLHTIGIGESSVDEIVGELEKLSNPTVGLAAHPGQVDIRITAKASTRDEAMKLINPIEERIKESLGDRIYGVDEAGIKDVVDDLLNRNQIKTIIVFQPKYREIAENVSQQLNVELEAIEITGDITENELKDRFSFNSNDLLLFLNEQDDTEYGVDLHAEILNNKTDRHLRFGGHPSLYLHWMTNQVLGFMREMIIREKGAK